LIAVKNKMSNITKNKGGQRVTKNKYD